MQWKKTIAAVLLCQLLLDAKPVEVLIDTSGSMKGREKEVLSMTEKLFAYSNKNGQVVGLTLFADDTQQLDRVPNTVNMNGGTNLTGALKELSAEKKDMKALIVMTDGMPNNVENAKAQIERMKKSGIKICGAYIGQSGTNDLGREFLKDNSDVFVSDSSAVKALESCFDTAEVVDVVKAAYEENIQTDPTGGW